MHQPVIVGVPQPLCGLAGDLAGIGNAEWSVLFRQAFQIDPVEQFHCQVEHTLVAVCVLCLHDVRVIELAYGLHLPQEPGPVMFLTGKFLMQDFQGDMPTQERMRRPVDRSESTPTERLFQQ